MTLPHRAEVVVIGGGVIGASVAWHLAARGCRDVLVLDRAAMPGMGSTGRATGGFRAQFSTATNVRLSLLARAKLRRFEEEVGADPGYDPRGYLLLADDEVQLERLRAAQRTQAEAGLRGATGVTPQEARELNPHVGPEGVIGGVFCPSDGFIRPLAILDGYATAAARLGATFAFGTEVRSFRARTTGDGLRLTTVVTSRGDVDAEWVVNAAGAWAAPLGAMAGVELPVRPVRRQVACSVPQSILPDALPMTVFVADGFHLRVRDGRVLLLMPGEAAVEDDTAGVEPAWLATVIARARQRLPSLAELAVERADCWTGLYEMSPDGHALLGPAPGTVNFFLANGSSGHGVMHAPALGALAADLLLDGAGPPELLEGLRPDRFARGAAHQEPDLF